MSMFNVFNKKEVILFSPVNGNIKKLEEVKDDAFASKLLGDGVAFEFDEDYIYSPCDGTIIMIFPTKHAIGIKAKNDAEVMLHIGLETVNLQGKYFEILVKEGQKVKRNMPIVKIDNKAIKSEGYDLSMPLLLTNCNEFNYRILINNGAVKIDSQIMVLKK